MITPTASATTAATCVSGTWQIGNDANQPKPLRYQSAHFALRWANNDVTTQQAQDAATQLELTWTTYMSKVGWTEPYCSSSTKYKVNVNIDPTWGLSGGLDGQGFPGFWVGPGALADHWGLAHEFTHALQGATGSFSVGTYGGWMWESHANWMAHQMTEYRNEVHCSELLVNAPHIYYGSTRDRYCNWQFLEYLKDTYGYATVDGIWNNGLKNTDPGFETDTPFSSLMRTTGWNVSTLNTVFGNWMMHNVNWDYVDPDGYDEGPAFRSAYGDYTDFNAYRALRLTTLDPLDASKRRYNVPFMWAPQRWGYNVVKLVPDAGKTSITVTFRGVLQSAPNTTQFPGLANEPASVPNPDSDWRWGIVAIDSAGKSRYGALMSGSDNQATFALKTGDKAVYMVVMATPKTQHKVQWDQPYYTVYRFPWMVQFTNAYPAGLQPNAAAPFANAHKHSNGGGWVSNTATVAASAYVGPYAQVRGGTVSGNARIQEHAIIISGSISGNAVVGGMTVVDNNVTIKDNAVVQTTFMGPGFFEPGAVIGGTAQLRGDVELRGGPTLTKGTYSGFVDQTSATDPAQGANLNGPVTEVTAPANLTWR